MPNQAGPDVVCWNHAKLKFPHFIQAYREMFEPLFLEGASPSNAGAVLVHGLGALNLC